MVDNYNEKDYEGFIKLGQELNPKFKELFDPSNNSNEEVYVYREENKVLGFIQIIQNFEICDILNIIVDKENRNKGIATKLLDFVIDHTNSEVEKIMLEVRESNEQAVNFYSKNKFIQISKRKNYYAGEDAIVMERILK